MYPQCLELCLAQSTRVTPWGHHSSEGPLSGFREGWSLGVGGRVARALTVAARPPSHPGPLPAPTGDLSPVVDAPPVEALDSGVDSGSGALVWPQLLALAR